MTKVSDLKREWLKDADVREEYDALADEFALAGLLIEARSAADMTQSDVARAMNTSQSYVARLESGRISPTFKLLRRYATATGSRLEINLAPQAQTEGS